MKTKFGELKEVKLADGKVRLVHERKYHTEIIEVEANEAAKIKKDLGIKKPRKNAKDI